MFRRAFAFFLLLTLAAAAPVRADETFRIGVLNDQSGPYADLSGPGGALRGPLSRASGRAASAV
jgi:hypothetical protein